MKQSQLFLSLKLKKDINRLFYEGYYLSSEFFNSRYLFLAIGLSQNHFEKKECTSILPIYIVWAVQKKLAKAHHRNTMKRVARVAFFETLQRLKQTEIKHFNKKLHLAFIPKQKFLDISFDSRMQAVRKLLYDIRFIK